MRSALRDAEATPPADGWARLERELKAPAPRISVLRRYWPRIAAAAAAVLILVGVGDFLLHENRDLGDDGFVIASASDGGSIAADTLAMPVSTIEAIEESIRAVIPSADEVRTATLPDTDNQAQPALLAMNEQSAGDRNDLAGDDLATTDTVALPDGTNVDTDPVSGASAETGQQDTAAANDGGQQKQVADKGTPANNATATRQYPTISSYYDNDQPRIYIPPRGKTSLSVFGGGGVTGAGTAATTPKSAAMMSDMLMDEYAVEGLITQVKYDYRDYSYKHHQPLSFGLAVRKDFAHGLSLESGVTYTLLWSDVRMKSSKEDISQKLHFIGIPLRMNWQFLKTGNFSMYAGAGGMVEKCVAAKLGTKSIDEKGVQWSVLGAVGAQYSFGEHVGLYFEPEASYYFTETDLRTSRTDSKLSLTLRLGVRLSF